MNRATLLPALLLSFLASPASAAVTCDVLFRMTSPPVAVANIEWSTDYSAAGGEFVGNGNEVQCSNLLNDALMAAHDDAQQAVQIGIVTLSGIAGTTDLAKCRFAAASVPAKNAFSIAVTTAGDLDGIELDPPPSVVIGSIACVAGSCGDGVTTDGEDCDDGNTQWTAGEFCTADCQRLGCGKPTASAGASPSSSDALFVLRVAVGQKTCDLEVCDVDASGFIVATDALRVLRKAVGLDIVLNCWSNEPPANCGDPGTPFHGAKSGSDYSEGGVVSYTCDACYWLSGSMVRTCQADGLWSGTQPTCTIRNCGDPGTPAHGSKTGSSTTCGSSVTYSCNNGYSLVGNASRSCQSDGTWSGTLPSCAFGIPAAPSGLTATPVSTSQVDLAWSDNSSNETGFKIERKTGAAGTYSQIGTAAIGAAAYSDTTASAATTYYYRVRAAGSSGDSGYSNEASATTPSAVLCPTSTPLTDLRRNCSTLAYIYVWQGAVAEIYITDGSVIAIGQSDGTTELYYGGSVTGATSFGLLYLGTTPDNISPILSSGSGGSITNSGYSLNMTVKLNGDTYLFNNAVFDSTYAASMAGLQSGENSSLVESTLRLFERIQ